MDKNRLEAFSDGVLAIIITIMVLELKQPVGDKWGDLGELSSILLSYALSFLFVAIYWVNHHIIFQSGRARQLPDPVVQHRVAVFDVVHPVHHSVDRRVSHIICSGVPLLCGYAARVPDLPPDGLPDRA